jgi:hypothetical protein
MVWTFLYPRRYFLLALRTGPSIWTLHHSFNQPGVDHIAVDRCTAYGRGDRTRTCDAGFGGRCLSRLATPQ